MRYMHNHAPQNRWTDRYIQPPHLVILLPLLLLLLLLRLLLVALPVEGEEPRGVAGEDEGLEGADRHLIGVYSI